MTRPRLITGLAEIAQHYDALLCDAWGVIHNGVAVFDGVTEALTGFRMAGAAGAATAGAAGAAGATGAAGALGTAGGPRPVFILTNAPRLSDVIPPQLDRLGLPRSAYDGVVTSGDATRAEISRMHGKRAFRIGPSKDDTMFESLEIPFVPLDDAQFVFCTGLDDDLTETPEDYRSLLTEIAGRRLPFICANPDIMVEMGGRRLYCGGALAQLYETLGGEVIMAGKPYAPVYDLALKQIAMLDPGIERARILAIGDGPHTDIKGANAQNIDILFIADGILREDILAGNGELFADNVAACLKAHDCHAEYAMQRLIW